MDEVTQQNSALVEENAATAKTLEHQARSMDQRVAAFRLRGAGARGADAVDAAFAEVSSTAAETAHKPIAAKAKRETKPETKPDTKPVPKPITSVRQPAAVQKRVAAGGPVGRMQSALAAAINADEDWQEF